MTDDEFCAVLDSYYYAYTRSDAGVDVTHKGYVYLSSLTTLPENTAFSNQGGVFLSSLTTLPENTAFNNQGGVYLARLTTLPENTAFNNRGYVDLSSLTEEYQSYRGQRIRLKNIDGSTMLILSERAGIYRAAYFCGGDLNKLKRCYVAKVGDHYAHGTTAADAVRDAEFKHKRDLGQAALVAEIKARGTVQFNDFRLITGACESGLRHGMAEAGLDTSADELPLDTVLAAVYGPFGETFRKAFA